MHLVSPLAAGIVGAENGIARIYRRGTSTRATVYPDFEASTADSSGDDIALDSTGGVVVYVNELVQVRVFSNIGELIRDFVAGEQAYAVEVISPSFTGTDYVTGTRAVSEPTTAGYLFDLWKSSSGAIDWKVLFNGSATRLEDAVGSIYGIFFNVKSPQFGAVGDGATDDTAAIQAAHDAADAFGGGVVVIPKGIYNISSVLSWKTGVHLFCVSDAVMIRQTTAATSCLAVGDSVTSPTIPAGLPTYIIGCAFDSTVSNSATQLTIAHSTTDAVIVDSCQFLCSTNAVGAGVVVANTAGLVHVRNSSFIARASVRLIYDTRGSAHWRALYVTDCDLSSWSGGAYGTVMVQSDGSELRVTGSRFYFQSTSGDTIAIHMAGTDNPLVVGGCHLETATSGDVAYAVKLISGTRAYVGDTNSFSAGVNRYFANGTTEIASEGLSRLALRAEATGVITSATTMVIPNETETYWVRSTYAAAAPTFTMPKIYYYGQPLKVIIFNNSGSLWGSGYTFNDLSTNGTSYSTVSGGVGIDNNQTSSVQFVAVNHAGTPYWVQVGGAGTAMPI